MERGKNNEKLAETRQRYYMNDHEFYRMVGILGAWDTVAADERQSELSAMRKSYEDTKLNLNKEAFNHLIRSFKQDVPLDPYESTVLLEACSQDLAAVMQADSGLLRPQRGREQIEVELRGFEEDYLRFFVDSEDQNQQKLQDMRQILRTTCLLRSVMKPFVKELTGFNWREKIEPYINKLSDILFSQLDADVMSPEVQQTIRLFWKYDIGGQLLWDNEYNESEHQTMKAECPPEFAADIDDLVLVSYLCAGGSHTKHRWFTNREPDSPNRQHPAVLEIDELYHPKVKGPGTLNRFFKKSVPSGPLKLEVASRRRAAKYLDCTPRVNELLEYYIQYAQADGTWSATLEIVRPSVFIEDVRAAINEQAIATGLPINALIEENSETGEVMSVSLVPDPSGSRGMPEAYQHETVASNLDAKKEWRRNHDVNLATKGDAYACIGIIPGYDHNNQPVENAISNALAMLKELRPEVAFEVAYRQLYAVWLNDGELINDPNEEPVLVVTATYFDGAANPEELKELFSEVAASLGQDRYFGGQKEQRARKLGALTFAQGS